MSCGHSRFLFGCVTKRTGSFLLTNLGTAALADRLPLAPIMRALALIAGGKTEKAENNCQQADNAH